LGLPRESAQVTGNIKFDLTLTNELRIAASGLKQTLSQQGQRLVFIAASTHQGEDEIVLDAFAQLRKTPEPLLQSLLLVLVPRHPERFDRVGQLCIDRGFAVMRRSTGEVNPAADILLGNTMGELLLLFGASDIAFVGGSLVPNGGHNFIEPAVWGLPLLSGKHVFNFAEVARLLSDAGTLVMVESADELARSIKTLAVNAGLRESQGQVAMKVAEANRGALDKTQRIIANYLL
jgi:3-deoxy-D-manno-octulosonic-acid transferase